MRLKDVWVNICSMFSGLFAKQQTEPIIEIMEMVTWHFDANREKYVTDFKGGYVYSGKNRYYVPFFIHGEKQPFGFAMISLNVDSVTPNLTGLLEKEFKSHFALGNVKSMSEDTSIDVRSCVKVTEENKDIMSIVSVIEESFSLDAFTDEAVESFLDDNNIKKLNELHQLMTAHIKMLDFTYDLSDIKSYLYGVTMHFASIQEGKIAIEVTHNKSFFCAQANTIVRGVNAVKSTKDTIVAALDDLHALINYEGDYEKINQIFEKFFRSCYNTEPYYQKVFQDKNALKMLVKDFPIKTDLLIQAMSGFRYSVTTNLMSKEGLRAVELTHDVDGEVAPSEVFIINESGFTAPNSLKEFMQLRYHLTAIDIIVGRYIKLWQCIKKC